MKQPCLVANSGCASGVGVFAGNLLAGERASRSWAEGNGRTVVTVAPITHSPPAYAGSALALPAATKQRLGLDGERSWVIAAGGILSATARPRRRARARRPRVDHAAHGLNGSPISPISSRNQ